MQGNDLDDDLDFAIGGIGQLFHKTALGDETSSGHRQTHTSRKSAFDACVSWVEGEMQLKTDLREIIRLRHVSWRSPDEWSGAADVPR